MGERHIPSEILQNILVRLPASSLQRLKSVSKEWFLTISDTYFAEAHFAHQFLLEFGCGFILGMKDYVLFMEGTSSAKLNPPQHINLPGAHGSTWVYGSCKGLVLFDCKDTRTKCVTLHVANPITGDSLTLPQFYGCSDPLFCASIGCGRVSEIKVTVLSNLGNKVPLVCGVLTLGSSSWREVQVPIPQHQFVPFTAPMPAGGALHWCYDHGILTFDIVQEKFRQTSVTFCPYFPRKGCIILMEWDRCLAVIYQYQKLPDPFYRVWIMRDTGWSILEIDYVFFNQIGILFDIRPPTLVASMRNGEVIIFWNIIYDELHLFAYDLHQQVLTNFSQFYADFFMRYLGQGICTIKPHVNSMLQCKRTGIGAKGATTKSLICRCIRKLFRCLCS